MYYGYQIIIGINAVFLKGLKYVNKYSIPAPAAQETKVIKDGYNYIYYCRDLVGGKDQGDGDQLDNEHEWNRGSLFKTSYLKKLFPLRKEVFHRIIELENYTKDKLETVIF